MIRASYDLEPLEHLDLSHDSRQCMYSYIYNDTNKFSLSLERLYRAVA
jgi:hypothetical protein